MLDKSIWRDVYNLHAECERKIDSPTLWDSVFWPQVYMILGKHPNNPFCMGILLEVHAELERTLKGGESDVY